MSIRFRLFQHAFLVTASLALSIVARAEVQSQTQNLTLTLPPGWHQSWHKLGDPGAILSASNGTDSFLAEEAESSPFCPTPREIESESGFEKGFWKRYESNFAASAKVQITHRDFRQINGIPFRVIYAEREKEGEKFYFECLVTPGNGDLYQVMFGRKGGFVEDSAELANLIQNLSFQSPPQLAWYQPWLWYVDEFFGLPLFIVAAGMSIYLWTLLRNSAATFKSKINVCTWGMLIAMINGFWIAGIASVMGILSILVFAGFILTLQRLNKEAKGLMAEGKLPRPAPSLMKRKIYIMIGSALFGLAIADIQIFYTRHSIPLMVGSNIFVIILFGFIFWKKRTDFFPPPTPSAEQK